MLGDLVHRDAEKSRGPVAQGNVRPDPTPVVVGACALGLADEGDERVGLDLPGIGELLQF